MPKKFPPEFKRDVVTVARRGDLPVPEVAIDFGISEESVRRWLRQADVRRRCKGRVGAENSIVVLRDFVTLGRLAAEPRVGADLACEDVVDLSVARDDRACAAGAFPAGVV